MPVRPTVFLLSQLVEANGKTIRENNLAIEHRYPPGTLVEVEYDEYFGGPCGQAVVAHLYVIGHQRDCDGSPLYMLGRTHPDDWPSAYGCTVDDWRKLGTFEPRGVLIEAMAKVIHSFGEDSLAAIVDDDTAHAGEYIPTLEKLRKAEGDDAD